MLILTKFHFETQLWKLVYLLMSMDIKYWTKELFAFEVLYVCQILIDFCETKSIVNSIEYWIQKICTFPGFGIIYLGHYNMIHCFSSYRPPTLGIPAY